MKLWSNSFKDREPIPPEFALCTADPTRHAIYSDDKNPDLEWSEVPSGTRSFALICHDPDAPSIRDDVNQEGKRLGYDLPRVDFFHWVLVDIPNDARTIGAGQFSDGVTARGKPGPDVPGAPGLRHGINDYTHWFKGDPDMEGDYYGYDGPCPPWNDDVIHRYVFTMYALDTDRAPVDGKFDGHQVRAAIRHNVLGEAVFTGTYTLNSLLGA
jgi:Raf kinase inhibitor-like YbhB/YbcL family protein